MRILLASILPFALLTGASSQTGPFVEKPYIQLGHRLDGKPNTLTIVWHGPDETPAYAVEYRQGKGGWKKVAKLASRRVAVASVTPFRVVEAEINGLKAGIEVEYRVTPANGLAFTAKVIAPKNDRQDYRFSVLGDVGIGTQAQAAVINQTYAANTDMLVITGDIVYGDGRISEYATRYFPFFNADTADPKFGAPLIRSTLSVGIAGNHDILNRDLKKYPDGLAFFMYWSQPLNGPLTQVGHPSTATLTGPPENQAAFAVGAGDAYPRGANFSFDYGNAHWTILDANRYVDWSDPVLRKWVADDLAKAKKKTWRFIGIHQPPFHSSASHQDEKQIRTLAEIFEKGGVDIVFGGHVHNYQRTFPIQVGSKNMMDKADLVKDDWAVDREFDGKTKTKPKGVIYIVDGAGGNRLYNPELNGRPDAWKPFQQNYIADFSVSIVDVSGKRLTLRQINKDGKEIDRIVLTK